MHDTTAHRAAEQAARHSYGRLLALLAARTRDIAAAEDALADALARALRHWPQQGVPDNPDAWLMTAARHTLLNAARHRSVAEAAAADLLLLADEAAPEGGQVPDDRLKLLFVCAHPAIDERVRTPLMLQTVMGLDAAQIGAAFAVPATTMGQRLVRAKAKIRDAGLRFELPHVDDMPARLQEVLDAVYAAFGTQWDARPLDGGESGDLSGEALYLARLLVALLPDEPEPRGLLALMLYCEARRKARRDADGRFVPLAEQDPGLWQREQIVEAEQLLMQASRAARFGRFQCEAAIQSVHVQRAVTGRLNHEALLMLYGLLVAYSPSLGARVGQAAALLAAGQPAEAARCLECLPPAQVERYQPYWVVAAEVAQALGDSGRAARARQRAVELTADPAVRGFLQRHA